MDLLAVDRRDEGLVHRLVHLVRDAVGRALGVVHLLRIALAQVRLVVVRHQLGKGVRRLHDALGVLVEHVEKVAFARQELAKQHMELQVGNG